jgi:DNA-binding NtrC family response regulator
VLITGDLGTGKSLFARVIHDLSTRHEAPFVVVDVCEGDPGEIGTILFGEAGPVEWGGAVREADGGTLYLKGLCNLPLEFQSTLLEVLGEPTGGKPDVRVIASTKCDIERAVAEGRLRQDLLSAVRGLGLHLPALRERSEDIPLLVTTFQREAGIARASGAGGFTVGTLEALASYRWPNNVRGLRHEVMRLVSELDDDSLVEVSDLAVHIREGLAADEVPPPDLSALAQRPLAEARDEFERWRILRALYDSDGNQSLAAQRLGLSRAGLFKKMRRLGLARTAR